MYLLFDFIEGEFLGCVCAGTWDQDQFMVFDSFEEAYSFFRQSDVWDNHWLNKNEESD